MSFLIPNIIRRVNFDGVGKLKIRTRADVILFTRRTHADITKFMLLLLLLSCFTWIDTVGQSVRPHLDWQEGELHPCQARYAGDNNLYITWKVSEWALKILHGANVIKMKRSAQHMFWSTIIIIIIIRIKFIHSPLWQLRLYQRLDYNAIMCHGIWPWIVVVWFETTTRIKLREKLRIRTVVMNSPVIGVVLIA